MKRFLIFIISFSILFFLAQMVIGWLLTMNYQPDPSEAWEKSANYPTEVVLVGNSSIPTFFIAIFSAAIAYFIPKAFKR